MGTEIRQYDKKQFVVHTTDDKVARRLQHWKACTCVLPYERFDWHDWPFKTYVVAFDFFFPRSHSDRVRMDLQKLGAAFSEVGKV